MNANTPPESRTAALPEIAQAESGVPEKANLPIDVVYQEPVADRRRAWQMGRAGGRRYTTEKTR
jgi:hypothetical protein